MKLNSNSTHANLILDLLFVLIMELFDIIIQEQVTTTFGVIQNQI